ncbi:DNA-directed RNA polymerase III subunit RPC7-like isoform X2 [Sinocyclocheilus grahami]|uniref:DNA-directed RNA polymerase III subunit RPC7-like isoform X2 n=1 Tax=Sinocyclocheilus grahami TaxID=75366 RepID=UPI0007AD0E6C|nr:PREDICTED: DNA-directed RNA polymerase III subunit RPC7-like isoform X2 [Sinocyclocheilus grahami]
MAGRGRGQLTFSVEIVGIGKGENLPPSSVQPTPLFPPLDQKPVPLQTGEEAEYMLALKQEFRGAMKTLPFYIRPAAPKKDVERYSDKYQKTETSDNSLEWKPDWRRFPKELRVREKRPLRDNKGAGEADVLMNECVKTSRTGRSALRSLTHRRLWGNQRDGSQPRCTHISRMKGWRERGDERGMKV